MFENRKIQNHTSSVEKGRLTKTTLGTYTTLRLKIYKIYSII